MAARCTEAWGLVELPVSLCVVAIGQEPFADEVEADVAFSVSGSAFAPLVVPSSLSLSPCTPTLSASLAEVVVSAAVLVTERETLEGVGFSSTVRDFLRSALLNGVVSPGLTSLPLLMLRALMERREGRRYASGKLRSALCSGQRTVMGDS